MEPCYDDCVAGLRQRARLPAEIRVQGLTDAASQWARPESNQGTNTPNKTTHKKPQQGDLWPHHRLNLLVCLKLHAGGGERLQQVVTDAPPVIGWCYARSSFFLTFTQLDLPLIGAPEAADLSTQCAVNTKFMNPSWLEGEIGREMFTANKTIRIIKGNYRMQSLFGQRAHCVRRLGGSVTAKQAAEEWGKRLSLSGLELICAFPCLPWWISASFCSCCFQLHSYSQS